MSGDISLYTSYDLRSKLVQVEPRDLEERGPKTCGDQVRSLWNKYQTSASVHGVAFTKGPVLYPFRSIAWSVVVVGMTIVLLFILIEQLEQYWRYPITTKVVVEYMDAMPFPTVTICNMNQFHRQRVPNNSLVKRVIFESSAVTRHNYSVPKVQTHYDTPYDVTGEELFNISRYAAHSLEDMLIHCEWKVKPQPCRDLFTPTATTYGTCYTFNSGRSDRPLLKSGIGWYDGLRVVVDTELEFYFFSPEMTAGIKVIVHEPDENPFPDTLGWSFRPGVSANVGFWKEEKEGLPYPFKAYGNSTCLDTKVKDFDNPLHRYQYSNTACIHDCFFEAKARQCNCTHIHDPGFLNGTKYRLCSAKELLECYIPMENSELFNMNKVCACPWECRSVLYQATMTYSDISSDFYDSISALYKRIPEKKYMRSNLIDLNLYFQSMGVLKTTQEPEASLTKIAGSVGGLMGLFLGASLISMLEIAEVLIMIVVRTIAGFVMRMNRIIRGANEETRVSDIRNGQPPDAWSKEKR